MKTLERAGIRVAGSLKHWGTIVVSILPKKV